MSSPPAQIPTVAGGARAVFALLDWSGPRRLLASSPTPQTPIPAWVERPRRVVNPFPHLPQLCIISKLVYWNLIGSQRDSLDRLFFCTESLRIIKLSLFAMSDDEASDKTGQEEEEEDQDDSDSDAAMSIAAAAAKAAAKKKKTAAGKARKRKKSSTSARSRSRNKSRRQKDTAEADSDEEEGDAAWFVCFRGMLWSKLDKDAMQLVGRTDKPILWPAFKKTKGPGDSRAYKFPTEAEQGVAVLNNFFILNATGEVGEVNVGMAKVTP